MDTSAKARESIAESERNADAEPSMLPSYTSAEPSPSIAQASSADAIHVPMDEPPAYTPLDTHPTHFTVVSTFISTPSGPSYQLSSALDVRGRNILLRRLRPHEIQQATSGTAGAGGLVEATGRTSNTPLAFDKSSVLYEISQTPISHDIILQGKRKSTLAGEIRLKCGVRHWYVEHKGKEILSLKTGVSSKLGFSSKRSKSKSEVLEWKSPDGQIFAMEENSMILVDEGDRKERLAPVLEVRKEVEPQMRELLIVVWTARLWVTLGQRKTEEQGGRLRASFMALDDSGLGKRIYI